MKWYRCLVRGENFPGELIGQDHLVGFYTTQFVQDENPQDAEQQALQLLKKHGSLQLPQEKRKSSSAAVFFEEVVEVRADDVDKQPAGLSFFPMEE